MEKQLRVIFIMLCVCLFNIVLSLVLIVVGKDNIANIIIIISWGIAWSILVLTFIFVIHNKVKERKKEKNVNI
jgi:hypothetical protein